MTGVITVLLALGAPIVSAYHPILGCAMLIGFVPAVWRWLGASGREEGK